MSATLIHPIRSDSKVSQTPRSIPNAARGTIAITDPLIDRFSTTAERREYLAKVGCSHVDPNGDFARSSFKGNILLNNNAWLESLADRPDIPRFMRSVLLTTFEGAVVRKGEIPQLIEEMRKFDLEAANPKTPTNLAEQIACLTDFARSKRLIGVCWNPWSGNVDAWRVYGESNTSRAYNIQHGTQHFFIYDRLGRSPT